VYIVRQTVGDTMVLDTAAGHAATHVRVEAFLRAAEGVLELPAGGRFPLDPDASFLTRLRFLKTTDLLRTREGGAGTLEVSGRPDLLALWAGSFLFDPGDTQGHHHPEQHVEMMGLDSPAGPRVGLAPGSDRVIIEAYEREDEG
jgi:hypothetical protein